VGLDNEMKVPPGGADQLVTRRSESWLERPLSGWWWAIGWVAATGVFVVLTRLLGGISPGDADLSIFSTWAIGHGHLACAYPSDIHQSSSVNQWPGPFIEPLWPLFAGGITALFGIGHTVPFPTQAALGVHCSTATGAMNQWSIRSHSFWPTMHVGYVGWVVLMGGAVAFLRTTSKGRTKWEPVAVLVLACCPLVSSTLIEDFHPEDLLTVGLVLCGLACVRRDRWGWAGILLGLALTTQQFSLLVIAPLVVIAPIHRRRQLVGSTIAAVAIVVIPMFVITSGRILAALDGTSATPSRGDTVLSMLRLHGLALLVSSRALPIVLAMVLASWASRKMGPKLLDPVPLASLMAACFALRLVFEINIFGYYFMALAVMLLMTDVLRARIRGEVVAWLVLIVLALQPLHWSQRWNAALPAAALVVVLGLIVHDVTQRRIRWYLVVWLALVALAFAKWPIEGLPLRAPVPIWLWQIFLVLTGTALAVAPLLECVKRGPEESPADPATAGSPHSEDEGSPALESLVPEPQYS
jgi:hypothetical protein